MQQYKRLSLHLWPETRKSHGSGPQHKRTAAAEIWGSDPIHPKQEVYEMLEDSMVAVKKGCGSAKAKRKKSTDTAAHGNRSDRGGASAAGGRGSDPRTDQKRGSTLMGGDRRGGLQDGGGNKRFNTGPTRGQPRAERGDSSGGGGSARGGGAWRGGPLASWRGRGYGRGRRGWAGGR